VAGGLSSVAGFPRIPIPRPPSVPGIGYRSSSLAWLFSFFVPGTGQYYLGGRGGVTLGTIHVSIHAVAATALVVGLETEEDDLIIGSAVILFLNWLASWIDTLVLGSIRNRGLGYVGGPVVDFDARDRSYGAGWKWAF